MHLHQRTSIDRSIDEPNTKIEINLLSWVNVNPMVLLESLRFTTQPAQRRGSISAEKLSAEQFDRCLQLVNRAVARALIGGGGVYSYIRVLPDEFLLKSVVFKFISKEISPTEHECMKIHPTN